MLEDQVAFLLQKYLGNYVRGLNKEALKISVWRGDVELTNMQLRPEALNALKLPVKVKAGFLGSVRLKVPWSRLGQEPVFVYLDRILILAEPATQVEGSNEDNVQEVKKMRVRELEMKMLESQQQLKSEINKSWLGSLISTIVGNLKLSITNIHLRYEDVESNPGHPFAAGITLARLSAVTIDDSGKETFATGGALDRIQKSAELEDLAIYFDSDIHPWSVQKPWENLHPSEWSQVFELEKNGLRLHFYKGHSYILQPVSGKATYTKLRLDECRTTGQGIQNAVVSLDDVTLCLSKDGYRDILKLADNFAAFNQRLKYAHYRPRISVKTHPQAWWTYAYKAVTDEMKKASGRLSWEQVLKYTKLRKIYVSLYASVLKADPTRLVVDDNKEIENLDCELDIEVILQWRMLAHKFVEHSAEADLNTSKGRPRRSWWSFGWSTSNKEGNGGSGFTEEDWQRLNNIIGYKKNLDDESFTADDKVDLLHFFLKVNMKHNASKLIIEGQQYLAELSCDALDCSIKSYSDTKVFDMKLGSYRLSSPYGILAESATAADSLVGTFTYKPFDIQVDWSFVAKASPCYATYRKDPLNEIVSFFKSSTIISQNLALETAAAVQSTIDGVRRSAQQQVSQALKDHSRFFLDLDIAAPKITIPTNFYPDDNKATSLLLDLGNLMLTTKDLWESDSSPDKDIYLQFNLVLSDVSAILVDGNFKWNDDSGFPENSCTNRRDIFPIIERCRIVGKLQQIWSENTLYPSMRLSVRLPTLGFHLSPARYHRLMQVVKLFEDDGTDQNVLYPWDHADLEGRLFLLSWKGVGNRDAVWQRRYFSLVGPYLYVLENPSSKGYRQYISLRGKQVHEVPTEFAGGAEYVLAIYDSGQSNTKVLEDINALILRCDTDESRRTWQNRLQGAIYRASGTAAFTNFSDTSYAAEPTNTKVTDAGSMIGLANIEKFFITGVLDELKICFSCSYQNNNNFRTMLLAEENPLMEFRALGGQVEISAKEHNLLIGTLLKSLEIEDQYEHGERSTIRYLARSFIKGPEVTNSDDLTYLPKNDLQRSESPLDQADGEEKFFEASEDLNGTSDFSAQREGNMSDCFSDNRKSSVGPPSFNRITGLIPDADVQAVRANIDAIDNMDTFVKAQVVIYDQDSPLYNNLDNRVVVTLATLSFFCYRPTILAILEFANAINIDELSEMVQNKGNPSVSALNPSDEDPSDWSNEDIQEPLAKGLLGNGKGRLVFYLTLNMAKAQIFLMNEDGTFLATLSQNNLLTDIKVFPSSFCVNAALGNLRICDDSLPCSHPYYWVCDMRDPEGSSFVELDFISFSSFDEDYEGYDYSLTGQLSEVRIVYLNRFVQEVISYFMGLVPSNSESLVKMKDHVTNSEKWVSTSEVEGSPALKLDLSLRKPIILMPKETESLDYLQLDVPHITVQNIFKWIGDDKNDVNSIHLEIMTIKIKDINLTIGAGTISGESIIQDVRGLSVVVRRSLRDLLHQIPETEVAIKVDVLRAALSSREYEIITECASSNFSEASHDVPKLNGFASSTNARSEVLVLPTSIPSQTSHDGEARIMSSSSVSIDLIEVSLHSGITRDSPLATVQASGAWLLYNSNVTGVGLLFATLQGFSIFDDREGTKKKFRLAVGTSMDVGYASFHDGPLGQSGISVVSDNNKLGVVPIPAMLILDAKFNGSSSNLSLCIQRPKMLVALDFFLALVEFFVPSISSLLSGDEAEIPFRDSGSVHLVGSKFTQPSLEFSVSPERPLVFDDERFDHLIYDGNGGKLYLKDRAGKIISTPCSESIVFVGSGKKLQFKNVTVVNGEFLDSCIFLGTNSSYSASIDDSVFLVREKVAHSSFTQDTQDDLAAHDARGLDKMTEFSIELRAIGPELTFYNTLKDNAEPLALSDRVMHANMDIFCRLIMKGDDMDMRGNALGVKIECNGIRVLEPFDTFVTFSLFSGKNNIHLDVSDIFMNFTFSTLRLFLAVEEDILAFLRMTSKKVTVVCSQFDKVGTITGYNKLQAFTFWRPRAPSGFSILGDCLTPLNEPPSTGVLAVNSNYARVKRPLTFRLVWPCNTDGGNLCSDFVTDSDYFSIEGGCSIWFPVAPKGYVSVGCVVSKGKEQPPFSSCFCILASLVTPCAVKDCLSIELAESHSWDVTFWRVENSFGSFLPARASDLGVNGKAYELRHVAFGYSQHSGTSSNYNTINETPQVGDVSGHIERSRIFSSGHIFEYITSFKLIWWNQGTSLKKLSIWRPIVSQGMAFLGDIAVQGYEPPNSAVVVHDSVDEALLKAPQDFEHVGHIKRQKKIESISFWLPQPPPGYVALGCIASKGFPKQDELSSLRCIRNDMVAGDSFPDVSIWDSSDGKLTKPFSLWNVGYEVNTFVVRSGLKKPPKRFALKLADRTSSSSDNIVIDAKVRTFSVAVFDDYGGLMVPLFNLSLSEIGVNLHGRTAFLSTTASFSLSATSYNDKYDAWEPIIEATDGFLRYQYDQSTLGATTQLRFTSTRGMNLNISVSNTNMMLQAYSSWSNLTSVNGYNKQESLAAEYNERSVIDVDHMKNYFIVAKNMLGQDIYMRATEAERMLDIIKMPSGDNRTVEVPVSKNLLESHVRGESGTFSRSLLMVIVYDAELIVFKERTPCLYTTFVHLTSNRSSDSPLSKQSTRTCGITPQYSSSKVGIKWNEAFFFKVDSLDDHVLEFSIVELGKGETVGIYSAPLEKIVREFDPSYGLHDFSSELFWGELSPSKEMDAWSEGQEHECKRKPLMSCGRIRCAALFSGRFGYRGNRGTDKGKPGYIQISPAKEGPWTTVRLNYAAPAACWRLGNHVIASEVHVQDGNRYVTIRSLVSIVNNTDFVIDVCLKAKVHENSREGEKGRFSFKESDLNRTVTDEFFEIEKYIPSNGWTSCSHFNQVDTEGSHQEISHIQLPDGWEWIDNWHVDTRSAGSADGWIYAPDVDHLQLSQSPDDEGFANHARQRRWIRHRRDMSYTEREQIDIGMLGPGQSIPLPLSSLWHPSLSYVLQLRPKEGNGLSEYGWSTVLEKHDLGRHANSATVSPGICVSTLRESDELLYCREVNGISSSKCKGLWFCLRIQAVELRKDIHSDPIHDWKIVMNPPLCITNYLPFPAEYVITDKQFTSQSNTCYEGIFSSGETVKIYNVDLRYSLYLSILPQGIWEKIQEAVPLSQSDNTPKIMSLRSLVSGRLVQLIFEQNYDNDCLAARVIRIYAPYWVASARCPPLTYRIVDFSGRERRNFHISFGSNRSSGEILWQITDEEIAAGYTILPALNFKVLGLSASIGEPGKECFGPAMDLSPLGDMDGSLDLHAYDTDGNCIHVFLSSKPSPFQAVPTKVISVCPFMSFTNRVGQDIFIKLNSKDTPKVLRPTDSRVSFIYHETGEEEKLQVRLEDTDWCFPIQIVEEGMITLVCRNHSGGRRHIKTEIRGYEDGSRFLVVFRLGSEDGPIRVENRIPDKRISIQQCGLDDDTWVQLSPCSSTNFSWDDPYGQKLVNMCVHGGIDILIQNVSLDKTDNCSTHLAEQNIQLTCKEFGDIMIVKFTNANLPLQDGLDARASNCSSHMGNPSQLGEGSNVVPFEVIAEFGIVGISLIDYRPRELLYIYLEKVFISYSTGYDAGSTSRFKVILGQIQLDNQLLLTSMPVLLVSEDMPHIAYPVFKATITMRNERTDGSEVYPYVYVRVTDKWLKLNIHEPLIWGLVDFYSDLRLDSIPNSSSATEVDPEIRIDLIDVSEVRLKISFKTELTQRPHGVLGIWSPILSAIGNAFKIQVHLRKVLHRSVFMRKSAIFPAILNRVRRDLIHNPLHLIFSVDVLGMTKSTLASLSKGFAELSTDGQFLQLRSKQVWSRRITGVSDGILQGTEALAQGVAFGVAGVVTKPVESAKQYGILGLAHGMGRAILGFVVQPLSGALDFMSLTVDGISASCARCLEIVNNKSSAQRIRNPRAIHADGIIRVYSEREATGQMILYLAEASRHLGCTDLFKEASKFAWSDYYENHFIVPYQRVVLITNKRVMLLQCFSVDRIDKKPSKILWDVPWEEVLALELAKAGHPKPSHVIIHLRNFRRSESFVRLIKCSIEEDEAQEPQAFVICSSIQKMWKTHKSDSKFLTLKVPSSQRHVQFSGDEAHQKASFNRVQPIITSRGLASKASVSGSRKFINHTFNFQKIWSSEQGSRSRYTLFQKQVVDSGATCSIWRPLCPDGYVSVGDVSHGGLYPPNVAAIFQHSSGAFAAPIGYDLVWRNCAEDYASPVSIWLPRAPDGFVVVGCVAVAGYEEPPVDSAYCVNSRLAEATSFVDSILWSAPDSYPWSCYIYQVQCEALPFIALRRPKEESDWMPMRVSDNQPLQILGEERQEKETSGVQDDKIILG